MDTANLLYLDLVEFDKGAILRGGGLILDPTTEPLEFRCTNGVRPTKLQKILWGSRLDTYIATDLLAKPLIQSLKQKFSVIVVRNEDFLDLRPTAQVPVVLLARDSKAHFTPQGAQKQPEPSGSQGAENAGSAPGVEGASAMNPVLLSPMGHFEPIVMKCHTLHQDDLKLARQFLQPLFLRRDVMEPFERIAQALQVVHEQNPKD